MDEGSTEGYWEKLGSGKVIVGKTILLYTVAVVLVLSLVPAVYAQTLLQITSPANQSSTRRPRRCS